jgi:hypothetical protein
MYASMWVFETLSYFEKQCKVKANSKVNVQVGNSTLFLLANKREAPSADLVSHTRLETERTRWDPKDGELCLSRVKPGETLVEARRDTDVQIVRWTWV